MYKDKFGLQAEDIVTGFKGTVAGCADYLTGCTQILISPVIGSDGGHREGRWFDVNRVKFDEDTKRIELVEDVGDGPMEMAPTK